MGQTRKEQRKWIASTGMGLKVGNFANEVKPASPLETPQRTWSIIADRASRSEALKRKVRGGDDFVTLI